MATTESFLKSNAYAKLAFVVYIEGYNEYWTTAGPDDSSAIATNFGAADWDTQNRGLDLIGNVGQSIELFNAEVASDSLDIEIVTSDDSILNLFRNANTTADKTFLTQDLDNNGTTMYVQDTSEFASSGHVYIGHERIQYTGKTATTFTGLTRGKNTLFAPNGGSRFGKYHRTPQILGSSDNLFSGTNPIVSSEPRVWYNRMVGVYLAHKEQGSWSTLGNSKLLWAGRIKSWSENGAGTVRLTCKNIADILNTSVFHDQYTALLDTRQLIASAHAGLAISGMSNTSGYEASTSLDNVSAQYVDVFDIVENIDDKFNAWQRAGTINTDHSWSCSIISTEEGDRVAIEMRTATAITARPRVFLALLSPPVWTKLGFPFRGSDGNSFGTYWLGHHVLERVDNNLWRLVAPKGPRTFPEPGTFQKNDSISVMGEAGTWQDMPGDSIVATIPFSGDGFLQVGENDVFYCQKTTSTWNDETRFIVKQRMAGGGETSDAEYADLGKSTPVCRQIWKEEGTLGDILLRLMLSTGTSGYNDSTYDAYAYGMGMGIPYGLIDVDSFKSLDIPYQLWLEEPTPFRDVLEPVASAAGRHIIFKDGKITLTFPGFEIENLNGIEELDEGNKASPDDRAAIEYSTEGMINRITIEYGERDFLRTRPNSFTVENTASITDHGVKKSMKLKANGILDPQEWRDYVVQPAVAHLGRPVAKISRTINHTLAHLVPGDICKLTDNTIIDPKTGTRGVSGLACWVQEISFDWQTGRGEVVLVFVPEHDASYYARYAPSALVDDTQSNGGYDTGSDTLTCYPNAFSRSGDPADATLFSADDAVHIVERSPATPGSPKTWDRIVASQSGNTITFNTALTAWDSSLAYVVEYQAKDAAGIHSRQLSSAYIAASTDNSTGVAILDANKYARMNNKEALSSQALSTDDNQTEFIVPPSDIATTAEPLSTHKFYDLYLSINNLINFKTRQIYLNTIFSPVTTTASHNQWVLGPMKVPILGATYGSSTNRDLKLKLWIKTSNASSVVTFIVNSSRFPPRGDNSSSVSYADGNNSVQTTTTSTSLTWSTTLTLTPLLYDSHNTAPWTWLTFEAKNGDDVTGATIAGVHCWEDEVS